MFAASPLSSEAIVTLKLAPVESAGRAGDADHGNIDAIAGCGAMNHKNPPAPTKSRRIAATAVRRFSF
jgi:hypothetical protein